MSRETENAMRKMMEYVEANRSEKADKAEIETLIQQYMARQADFAGDEDASPDAADYLELAEDASSRRKKLEYLNKALALEPDNLDAARMLAEEQTKTADEYLEALAALIAKADRQLEEEGTFRESTGDFWLVFETRPYMRLRCEYMDVLVDCGKLRAAAAEGRRMLELCEGDNLGIRFRLMHIYALLEEAEAAEKLFEKYGDNDESLMLLPLTILYYKLNRPEKAAELLKRLASSNKDTKKFFSAMVNGKLEQYFNAMSPYGYRPYSMDELMMSVADNDFLYCTVTEFFLWAEAQLKQTGGKKTVKKAKK